MGTFVVNTNRLYNTLISLSNMCILLLLVLVIGLDTCCVFSFNTLIVPP